MTLTLAFQFRSSHSARTFISSKNSRGRRLAGLYLRPNNNHILGGYAMKITVILEMAVVALGAALSNPVVAQDKWPTRPIKLVVPLAAGGGVDLMARIIAERLSDQLGQRVIIENNGGAGGTIAAASVARAEPDGYTFIFQSVSSAVVNALVYKNLTYDPIKDFKPVTLAARFPLVGIVSPDLPVKNTSEFVALLKANPGKYSYGSSGVGTVPHLAAELFKSLAGVDMVHVPYRGNSAVMPDLLTGRIALVFDGIAPQIGNIKEGKVKALGVTTAERSKALPDLPAIGETVKGFEVPFWTAIYAPANTPQEVVDRLAAETAIAVKHPESVRRFADLGVEGVGSSPEELDRFWHQQLEFFGKIVKDANISLGQ
jgi:tripartite-type tricarboxylate transporter receptor subunit TctC